ncbi:MAG: transposase [Candidatus Melainabacteria bacterium]|nr:transposase [Candidatus Melainabacteria bacterium]
MPIKDRKLYPGAIYHVFDRGVAKQPIFLDDEDRETFITILEELYLAFNFVVHAFCLMGNHFHLLIQTFDPNLPDLMERFMGRYVKYFNSKYSRPGHLYQGRYNDRNVESEVYFATLFRYFALNPVGDSPYLKPEDCIWSSFYDYYHGIARYCFLRKTVFELLFNKYQMDKKEIEEFVKCASDKVNEQFCFNDVHLDSSSHEPVLISNYERTNLVLHEVESIHFTMREKKQIVSFLLKTYTTNEEKLIANLAGYKSTSSVHNSCKFIRLKRKSDNRVKRVIEKVESQIGVPGKPKLAKYGTK